MKRRKPRRAGQPGDAALSIEERYGLEPVFEPGNPTDDGAQPLQASELRRLQCPYCGEPFEALLDPSAGSARYVEDCPVCCQPIELDLEVDYRGRVRSVGAARAS